MVKSVSEKTDAPVFHVQQSVNEKFTFLISFICRLQKSLSNTLRTIHEKEKEQADENLKLRARHQTEQLTLKLVEERNLNK